MNIDSHAAHALFRPAFGIDQFCAICYRDVIEILLRIAEFCILLTCVIRFSLQLHFIESYLRESNPEFDHLNEEDQMKMKEKMYVEVNRYGHCQHSVTYCVNTVKSGQYSKTGTERFVFERRFSLASHFFWGLWSLIQARLSTIKFGYLVSKTFCFIFCPMQKTEAIDVALNSAEKPK